MASLVATVKDPRTMQETQVQSLGWENPLEKGMATCSSILTWKIPWTEESGGLIALWKESYDKPRQCSKKQRHHFANKGL